MPEESIQAGREEKEMIQFFIGLLLGYATTLISIALTSGSDDDRIMDAYDQGYEDGKREKK